VSTIQATRANVSKWPRAARRFGRMSIRCRLSNLREASIQLSRDQRVSSQMESNSFCLAVTMR
jgi:hypothetical protein